MGKQHLGIIGLGVMGSNLAFNAESKGFSAAGYDLGAGKVQQFAALGAGKNVVAAKTLPDFVNSLEEPRRILMMVPAGAPVDAVLRDLKPHLKVEDIVIDGGNSYFKDTDRRVKELEGGGLRFFGMGVSGGEEGALHGPSLMPGGHEDSYKHLAPVLTKMAAQTEDGACCTWLGPRSAGHYVKMVHNGIEYGIMQALCEVYDLLKSGLGFSTTEIPDTFAEWSQAELGSFLVEISALVLSKIDSETKQPLVDMILDEGEQKGTGKWTAQDAMDLGVAVPTLTTAVCSRILSGQKDERVAASAILTGPSPKFSGQKAGLLGKVRHSLAVTMAVCYAQGFEQLRVASAEYQYNLNPPEIARIWKGGCIIRSKMLDPIATAFRADPGLKNLLLDSYFSRMVNEQGQSLREVVATSASLGIPCPALAASLAYIDSYRRQRLPANFLQALRDCFGAHTYRRTDKPGVFHTEWKD